MGTPFSHISVGEVAVEFLTSHLSVIAWNSSPRSFGPDKFGDIRVKVSGFTGIKKIPIFEETANQETEVAGFGLFVVDDYEEEARVGDKHTSERWRNVLCITASPESARRRGRSSGFCTDDIVT